MSSVTSGSLRIADIRAPGGQGIIEDRAQFQSGDTVSVMHTLRHVDDDNETFTNPAVMWLKNGIPVGVTPSNVFGEVSHKNKHEYTCHW